MARKKKQEQRNFVRKTYKSFVLRRIEREKREEKKGKGKRKKREEKERGKTSLR